MIAIDSVGLVLIIAFVLNLYLGTIIIFDRRSKINIVYFINIIFILSWIVSMFFYRISTQADAMFWCILLYIFPTFVASSFLYFTYIFPSEIEKNIRIKAIVIFLINFVIVGMVAVPGLIIKEVNIRPGLEKEIIFSDLYWLYFFYTLLYFSYGFNRLWLRYRKEAGHKRQQIIYLLFGYALAANLAFITNLTMPWLGYFFLNWFGQVATGSMVIFTTLAIIRYRLMDIRVVVRNIFLYFLDSCFAFGFYVILIVFYPRLFGSVYSSPALIAGIFVGPIFVFLFLSFHKFVSYILDRFIFHSFYNYQKTISELTRQLNSYKDLDQVVNLIVDTIKKTMGLNRAGVLLAENDSSFTKYKIAKVTGFDINNGISLVRDNFFTNYLKKIAKPLVREELPLLARDTKNSKEKKSLLDLEREMNHIEASLCLPLLKSGQLMGIIVLGAKESGDPYTNEDLNLLSTLSMQAGIAIDNARMYQETKNFNKVLQQKVDEQTQELQERAIHLEKLLKMREEFLDIASHQLKTPVSVIRGTISMFRDGSMDKLPQAEKQKFFDNIYHKTEKLNLIISDILRASEIESEEFKIDSASSKKVQLEEILQSVHDDLKELAVDKKIKLELVLPPKKLSPIMTSADFLEQAIYNLVDNAIKYTQKGFVRVELSGQEPGVLTVKVSDSGIGIPASDQKKMFDKFSRAKNAVNMYTDGTGLGLFIAKQIVEAHEGGSLVFVSKEGEGTTFTIKLKALR